MEWNIVPPNGDSKSEKIDQVKRIPSNLTKNCLREKIMWNGSPHTWQQVAAENW